jgi:hypothetical protein
MPKRPAIKPAKMPVPINKEIEKSKSPDATLLKIVLNT